jgi:hypothetical protein
VAEAVAEGERVEAVAEGERVHSHLLWLGLAGHFLGYNTVYMWVWKLREEILDVMEILSGNRNNYAIFKPGGVRRDFKAEDIPIVIKKIDSIIPTLDKLKKPSWMILFSILSLRRTAASFLGLIRTPPARAMISPTMFLSASLPQRPAVI